MERDCEERPEATIQWQKCVPTSFDFQWRRFLPHKRKGQLCDGDIMRTFRALCQKHAFMVVEGVGGVHVPITQLFNMSTLSIERSYRPS